MAWNRAGLCEELLDLLELLDRLVAAGDVGEGDLRLVLRHLPGLGLAELHDSAAAALHRVEDEQEQAEQDDHGSRLNRRDVQTESSCWSTSSSIGGVASSRRVVSSSASSCG